MGMTIDDIVTELEYIGDCGIFPYTHDNEIVDKTCIRKAINIIQKYQKIEQILDDCDLEAWEVLEKIKEVVEDDK